LKGDMMHEEIKAHFGKLLGEIYCLKNKFAEHMGEQKVYPGYIVWGLKHGVEPIVNQYFHDNYTLTLERYDDIVQYLENISDEEVSNINGFYDLSKNDSFTRGEWQAALILLKAEGRFTEIISRIENSEHTPMELKDLNV